jgi:hypothetical protein
MKHIVDTIQRLVLAAQVKPGSVNHIYLRHDDHCPALKSESLADCTCDPDIEVRAEGKDYE